MRGGWSPFPARAGAGGGGWRRGAARSGEGETPRRIMDVERLQEALKGGAGARRGGGGWGERCPHAEGETGAGGFSLTAATLSRRGRERRSLRAAGPLCRGRGSGSPCCGEGGGGGGCSSRGREGRWGVPMSPLPRPSPRACCGLREGEQGSDPAGSPPPPPPPPGPGLPSPRRPDAPPSACRPLLGPRPSSLFFPPPPRPRFCAGSLCWVPPGETRLFLCCSRSKEVANQLLLLRCL